MRLTLAISAVRRDIQAPAVPCRAFSWLVCLALVLCALPALAQAPAARGVVRVAVFSDLTAQSPLDLVTISIEGAKDRDTLMLIAQAIGKSLGVAPVGPSYSTGQPPFSEGFGLTVQLPMMTRDGQGTLPIAAILAALAPYAERARIVYLVTGTFSYTGHSTYATKDLTFTVESHNGASDHGIPLAIYDVDANIKNPALTLMPEIDNPSAGRGINPHRVRFFILLGLALLIGISGGILLAMLLKQWKAEDAARAGASRGDRDDRKRDDA